MAMNDIWTSKDGTEMKMKDMEDSHLLNSIEYFKPYKDRENVKERWKLLMTEKKRRDKKNQKNDEKIENRWDILDL